MAGAAVDAAPAVGTPRRALAAVAVVFFVHGLLFASWTAHIPHVKAHLGINDGTLGIALLGVPLGSVTAMASAAFLIPRVGSRPVVLVSLAGYALSGPIVGLTGSVPGLFAALFLWGAFQGVLDISMNTQAIAVERRRGRPLMNGMHAGWSLGAFAGAGAGAAGVALGVTLSQQLLLLGVPALLLGGWLSLGMLPDRSGPAHHAPAGRAPRRLSGAMLALGSIAFASMLGEGAAADWSSVYLHDSVGASKGVAGLGYAAFALAMVIVRLAGNRLLDRYPERVLLPVLAAVAGAGFGIGLLVERTPVSMLGLFLLGFGLGAIVPTVFSAAGRLPGMHPGIGVAAVSAMGWAGFVLGPPLIGQLADLTSLPLALAIVPVLLAYIAVATRRVQALRRPV